MDISVVIPIYGCRAALEELHRRLTDTLVAIDKEYEIILVMIIVHRIRGR